ncbi:ribosome hibernation promoting factor HPF [Kingella potus]|uniref:Ribosome hibernation promoting factor n=1 Tax=Kingella potus TaxID=265175 RepID=A0A377R374_9NEIS|nr:ribosome-associated translation inhibitor RaiA [Kingella potus]UOP01087.1 ribosome-associated translation inhibitor RaiA [Kingella potus]STR00771.1 ribosome hibernation promoting factor HPF [Kingella potus]
MNLKITGLNFDVTEAVREHVALKLERISRHAGNLISVTVTLSLDKPEHKAEADAHLSGKNVHVEAVESENMYAAIDVMMDKLDRALIKHKEKSNNVRGAGKPAVAEAEAEGGDEDAGA